MIQILVFHKPLKLNNGIWDVLYVIHDGTDVLIICMYINIKYSHLIKSEIVFFDVSRLFD